MKLLICYFTALIFSFTQFVYPQNDSLWKKLEAAKKVKLPQTALKILDTILSQSQETNRHGEWAKAICEQILIKAKLQGNEDENRIRLLEKELNSADTSIKPLLQIVLARWYWRYYDHIRYNMLSRTEVDSINDNDFTTWTAKRLFSRIDSLYLNVIKERLRLLQIPVTKFKDFLEPGTLSEKLRPTLYDFALWEAMTFYTSVDQIAAKPADNFEINGSSAAFGPLDSFLKYTPFTTDKGSPKYKSFVLFKTILKHYRNTNNTAALIDADLHRLTYVRANINGDNLDDLLIKRFNEILNKYGRNEYTALVRFRLARAYYDKGEYKKAYVLAEKDVNTVKDSIYQNAFRWLISLITTKDLSISYKDIILPLPWELNVKHRNFNRIYFRIVKDDWERLLEHDENLDYRYRDQKDSIITNDLLNRKPILEWEKELGNTEDFKEHTIQITMPQMDPGFYKVFASWEPDFKNSKMVQHASIQVSSLLPVLTHKTGNNSYNRLVVNAITGLPLEDVTVTLYNKETNRFVKGEQGTTDSLGYFSIENNYNTFIVNYQKGNDQFLDNNEQENDNRSIIGSSERAVVFTDRSIYRPGQKIYFKGIYLNIDQKNDEYSVLTGKALDVILLGPGSNVISRQTLVTNEFGSISGTFTAPTKNTLNGKWWITIHEHKNGNALGESLFRIEEYKRPSFTVDLQKPDKSFHLNDSVFIYGQALAYTGAPINGAKVKYCITRKDHRSFWWEDFYESNYEEKPFDTSGEAVTDFNGAFRIPFFAEPDSSVPKKDNPVFPYYIDVDVTSADGETRNDTITISLGYKSLDIELQTESYLKENIPFNVYIKTTTLDGEPVNSPGALKIFSLKEPAEPVPSDYLESKYSDYNDETNDTLEGFARPWQLWPIGKLVEEMQFNTPIISTAVFKLKCGMYKIEATTKDRFGAEVKSYLPIMVLPGNQCIKFPLKVPSVAFQSKTVAEVGDTVNFLWGTGYNRGRAYIELEMKDSVIKNYWTDTNSNMHSFSIPVKEEYRGGFSVYVTFVQDHKIYYHSLDVNVPWTNKMIACSLSTFRSTIEPGQNEKWTVTLKGKTQSLKEAEAVVSMYDYSLDQIYPHTWSWSDYFYKKYTSCFVNEYNPMEFFNVFKDDWNQWVKYQEMTYYHIPRSIDWDRNKASIAGIGYGCGYGSGFGGVDDLIGNLMGGDGGGGLDLKKRGGIQVLENNIDLSKVNVRKNLEETAFFYPHLKMDDSGKVSFDFTAPQALTTWKLLVFAHGKHWEHGGLQALAVTRKKLMIQPNAPRFLREGDTIYFTARVTNMSDSICTASANLELTDFASGKAIDSLFGLENSTSELSIPANQSKSISWKIAVPDGCGPVVYTVKAASKDMSDGESGMLPVLSSRIPVIESFPISIRGPQKKNFTFDRLGLIDSSKTMAPKTLTVQMTSNPAWYVLQTLPYLIEYPYECSEQLFNKYYANLLGSYILNSNPKIREVFSSWTRTDALKSNLEKNEKLKQIVLEETPWVSCAKKETSIQTKSAELISDNTISANIKSTLNKLRERQLSNGAWPWFEDKPDMFITLYIVSGFGRLKSMNITADYNPALNAMDFLDNWISEIYKGKDSLKVDYHLIAMYLYARSSFLKEKPIPSPVQHAVDFYLNNLEAGWTGLGSKMSEAHTALTLNRFGKHDAALLIMKSLKERSLYDEQSGRFWPEQEQAWRWYNSPVETQALMIEAFDEITHDSSAVEECKLWLVKQKRTLSWNTTKATADAVYALIKRGNNLLNNDKLVDVSLGTINCTPSHAEAGTGYYEKIFTEKEITPEMKSVSVSKTTGGLSWGAIHLQYLEEIGKVTSYRTNLKIEKQLFINRTSKNGDVMTPISGPIKVGDLITVRLIIKSDENMEYVHLKDMRASGMEPLDALSGYKYTSGAGYYQSTKDVATNFFFDLLPKGTHVIEYKLRAFHAGIFQSGIAQIQCMYAPEFNSHSGSVLIDVMK
jgi:uncharacterized protein YfaS (alpha-2-macroglobulin family)